MNSADIKIEHWIIRYPHGDKANGPGSSNAGGPPWLFEFRGDYRLASFTYHSSFLIDPIDLIGKKQ